MLKLRKVQILGFKSFCDRTEVLLSGEGIAAIVGPNGCGKSNISDAITWVLGEQSAKSLRGVKMEDVIFAGTRDRRPTGMAEVSLTLIDPDLYDGSAGAAEEDAELVLDDRRSADLPGDWDELLNRQERAAETEEAVAEAQPGTTLEGGSGDQAEAGGASAHAQPNGETTRSNAVVLKIRRRRFSRAPVRAGEVTVTRRLFRSGDSEYLLNGRICRLRDIQDIFSGTGLGGESYAMIGQERIGQLLSSKPLDRRALLEEAAGITRFKNKKRLAELRLESARANLSRVNDIFDEVTRQMGTLKRQAAKAERYTALRDDLRGRLRVVLSNRLRELDEEQAAATAEVNRLSGEIDRRAVTLAELDSTLSTATGRGYTLDAELRQAHTQANGSAVELERVAGRLTSNADRVADLSSRIEAGTGEIAGLTAQISQMAAEAAEHRLFLDSATAEAAAARTTAEHWERQAGEARRSAADLEGKAEEHRRGAVGTLQRSSQIRNEIAQAEAALAGLDREAERLARESETARGELEALGRQRGQARLSFESVTERFERLEREIAGHRLEIEARRGEESQSRRRGDALRGEVATMTGRRTSLETLIREHSYSTDTVRNLFKANAGAGRDSGGTLAPIGTLADFLEVDGRFENVVDEFLRDELNYIVVPSWEAADAGIGMLQNGVAGRATFLVHPSGDASPVSPEAAGGALAGREDVVALTDCVRVQNGFGRSLAAALPKLRDGYVVEDAETARSLATEHPQAFFLSPRGETFHNITVTGGRPRAQGPLALKRDLAELQRLLAGAESELAATDLRSAALGKEIGTLTSRLEQMGTERREAEREAANSGAALRQMDSEAARIERRLEQWQLASESNRDQRNGRVDLLARRGSEAEDLEAQHAALDARYHDLQTQLATLRGDGEAIRQAAAAAAATLAGLEERRRSAQGSSDQTERLLAGLRQRTHSIETQMEAAATERERREAETGELHALQAELTRTRAAATAEADRLTTEATDLRSHIAALDTQLRALRGEADDLRERRSALSTRSARLASDIEHMEAACRDELSATAAQLREDDGIERIDHETLLVREEEARALKGRMEAMGPVNMMALEEFEETSSRHTFLEAQRRDLLDSIENTQSSIREIDEVSRVKFDEAFRVINSNFSATFTKLFGGGVAMMKLTDEGNTAESGVDIIASPPGKKLQNVLLLSGGEKALTALSLLVGIFQFQPAPFCVLDEVDAPLDETNVGRFARMIHEMSATTQFVVITHSKRTMSEADVIYGVTMQEPGVSKIVSVNLGGRRSRLAVAREAVA